MSVCAAAEEEEGAFTHDDGPWDLQSKQGESKKHKSIPELCCSTLPITVEVQESFSS